MSWVVLLLYETTERSSSLSWVAAYCLSERGTGVNLVFLLNFSPKPNKNTHD